MDYDFLDVQGVDDSQGRVPETEKVEDQSAGVVEMDEQDAGLLVKRDALNLVRALKNFFNGVAIRDPTDGALKQRVGRADVPYEGRTGKKFRFPQTNEESRIFLKEDLGPPDPETLILPDLREKILVG